MESVKSRLRKVRGSYKSGDYGETVLQCEGVLELKEDCYEACLYLGKASYSLEDIKKAEASYVHATQINDSHIPAWQGLAEVYEKAMDLKKAIPVMKKLIDLTETDSVKKSGFKIRLARMLADDDNPEAGMKLLQDVLKGDLEEEIKLSALSQLADIQLMSQESLLEAHVRGILESRDGAPDVSDENLAPEALRVRAMGEYMEEALQANSPLCLTLKSIVQIVPPFPPHVKYYESFLLMYCKAIYSADPQSLTRYHLRVQTLEQCYKMIMRKEGGCCTPFPFITALRLLEIKEEIMGCQQIAGNQETGTPVLSRRTSSTGGSLKNTTSLLHSLPPASDPSIDGKNATQTMWELKHTDMKTQVSSFQEMIESAEEDTSRSSPGPFSPNSYTINTGCAMGSQSTCGTPQRTSGTGSVGSEIDSRFLPTFMRSYSLEVVRRLHRLGSGVLPESEDFIGSNAPMQLEVTEQIGCRLIHMFPWEAESNVQLALALRRRRENAALVMNNDEEVSQKRVTHLHSLPKRMSSRIQNWNKAVLKVLRRGLTLGSRSAVAQVAVVELMLEEGDCENALAKAQEALCHLEKRQSRGGYPMTQAYMTLRLLAGNAYLGLNMPDEAEKKFYKLIDSVSEGEASFGWMTGSIPYSLRQSAHRGLAHVALARGDRVTARQKFEEVLGASMMGKAPVEHWAEAEYGWMLYEDGHTLRAKNHMETALEILRENPLNLASNLGEYGFKMAQIYWTLGGRWRADKSFAHAKLMEAAKYEGSYQADVFALLGKFYHQVEMDKQKARKCYQRALALDPAQSEAGEPLLELLTASGTPLVKLLGFCEEMISRDPAALWALEGKGRVANALGDYQSAVTAYKNVLKKRLNDAGLWEAIGAAYQGMGRLTASLKSFTRAVEIDPTCLFALVQAGKLNAQIGEHEESLSCFEQALEIDGNYPPALLGMAEALMRSSQAYLRKGITKIAADLANKAHNLAARCTKVHGNLKSAWKLLGDVNYLHHAMPPWNEDLSTGCKRQSAEEFVEHSKAAVDASFHQVQASKRAYAHALHLDPSEGTFYGDVAAACYQEARLRKFYKGKKESLNEEVLAALCERLLCGGISLSPTSIHLWEALGMCASSQQLREYALHRALQLNPKQITAWVALAQMHQDCQHQQLADACLEHARGHDPQAVSIWEGMASLSTHQSPLELYEHAVGLGGSPHSFLGYAIHAVRNGQAHRPEVYACAKKAVQNHPLHPMGHHALGICEEARGSPLEAVYAFDTAMTLLRGSTRLFEAKDWSGLKDVEASVLIAKARALCRARKYEEGKNLYMALEAAKKLEGKWAAQVGLGKALWKTGEVQESIAKLADIVDSRADVQLKLVAVKALIGICIAEDKLAECGKLVDKFCNQVWNSPQWVKYEEEVPKLYLALLAGAYANGAEGLIPRFLHSASARSKEASVAGQAHFIQHLVCASSDPPNPKLMRSRIRQAVHTAPWDSEIQEHLMKISSSDKSLRFAFALNPAAKSEEPKDVIIKELKKDISTAISLIHSSPEDPEMWCKLAVLHFQAALTSCDEQAFAKLRTICKRVIHQIDLQDPGLENSHQEAWKIMKMHMLMLLSESAILGKEDDWKTMSMRYAAAALKTSKGSGAKHEGFAERHLGRISMLSGEESEGESCLRGAMEKGDRIAILELGAMLVKQGKEEQAHKVLERLNA